MFINKDKVLKFLLFGDKGNSQAGLTLMELVIVVLVIGTLSGIAVNVINSESQQNYANDSVKRANLRQIADGVEAYFVSERSYPDDGDVENPLDNSAANFDILNFYLETWPGADYRYFSDGTIFVAQVVSSKDSSRIFKISSTSRSVLECDATSNIADPSDCD